MYDIYVGEQKSLVFPIMCNAHVSIAYDDNIPDVEDTPSDTTDDVPYGLWAHEGSFSFDAIITPYDINGETTPKDRAGGNDEKMMPANTTTTNKISQAYLNQADRNDYEMMLFYNSKFSISLVNTTTSLTNSPAEYKIKVSYYDSSTVNINSSTVISAVKERMEILGNTRYQQSYSGFNEDGFRVFDDIGQALAAVSSGRTIVVGVNSGVTGAAYYPAGTELFTRDGFDYTSIGVVASLAGNNPTLVADLPSYPLAQFTRLYVHSYKEPKYVHDTHHIAVSYNENNKSTTIYYNGEKVGTGIRASDSPTFVFDRSDFLIGRATTDISNAANYANTAKQFMGEMHEMCLQRKTKSKFQLNTLVPSYSEALLYLRFEEEDL